MRNGGSERCEVRMTPTALAGSAGKEKVPAVKGCRQLLEAGKDRRLVSHEPAEENQPWFLLEFSPKMPILQL